MGKTKRKKLKKKNLGPHACGLIAEMELRHVKQLSNNVATTNKQMDAS